MSFDLVTLRGVKTEEEFMLRFADFMRVNLADGRATADTLRTYASHIGKYLNWCQHVGIHPLRASKMDVQLYRSWMVDQGFKRSTISLKLGVIRRFYLSALETGIIKENPAAMVSMSRDANEEIAATHYLTAEEAEILFSRVPKDGDEVNLRARAIIGLMALQGLRTIEVHRLNVEDHDFSEHAMYVRGKKRNRVIFLRDETEEAVQRYLRVRQQPIRDAGKTPVFVAVGNRHGGHRLSRDGVREIVDYWLEEAQLKKPGLSCHSLRHTFGTLLYEATKDLRLVQEELGHASYETTTRYAHLVDRKARRAAAEINIKF